MVAGSVNFPGIMANSFSNSVESSISLLIVTFCDFLSPRDYLLAREAQLSNQALKFMPSDACVGLHSVVYARIFRVEILGLGGASLEQ